MTAPSLVHPTRRRPRREARAGARRFAVIQSVGRLGERVRPRLPLVLVVGSVIAIVAVASVLQVRLIAGQRHLDGVNRQIEEARIRRDELRRREAGLRSPAQIAQIASDELGMVRAAPPALVPPRVVSIAPTPTTVP